MSQKYGSFGYLKSCLATNWMRQPETVLDFLKLTKPKPYDSTDSNHHKQEKTPKALTYKKARESLAIRHIPGY